LLEVVPYGNRPVRVGDVVLFMPPEGDQPIVHRVVCVRHEGIRTCGDNCLHADPWRLTQANITGQVTVARRGRHRRKVIGGRLGRLKGSLMRQGKVLDRRIALVLHPLYRLMSRSGMVHRLLPHRLRPRVVMFQADGFPQLRLLLGRRIVGRYDVRRRQWHIRRPFRLFVNEPSLPVVQEGESVPTKFMEMTTI